MPLNSAIAALTLVGTVLGTVLGAAPVHAAPELKTIPQAFQGRWSSELDACGNRESGLPFTVGPTSITYFEEADTVVAVDRIDDHTIQVAVDYEDYDGVERLLRTLILSQDRQKLMFDLDADAEVNHRCPQGPADGA